jgi:uncharacterized membrane protein YdjX (TVP38/TMEM64 family)
MLARTKWLVIAAIWFGLFLEILLDAGLRSNLQDYLEKHPIGAPLTLVLAQIVLASFVLPCSPLSMLAGMLWGFSAGLLYSITATVISSLWTFLLGKYVIKPWLLERPTRAWQRTVIDLVNRHHWKASMLAHANPLLPGSSIGYAFGVSDVALLPFAFGALMGTLPLQLVMVAVGHISKHHVADQISIAEWISSALPWW